VIVAVVWWHNKYRVQTSVLSWKSLLETAPASGANLEEREHFVQCY